MRYLLPIFFLGFVSISTAQTDSITEFDSLLSRAHLTYTLPEGHKDLDIEFLHKIPHNKAIGPTDSSYQIRYWIRPLDTWVADHNKKSKKEKKNSMQPNALCKSMMMLAVLDASNNKSQGYQESQYPELTKQTYNADWEASTIVESGWPQVAFKYCYIWCLHKDDIGDVYIYVLADKKEDFSKIIGNISTSIKFK
ncbi:MAG: hypothetical protein JKY52_17175 [Flavobacteriales bacterium]|nr:hypothetical protein [Flavobacteriales bacterium]